MQLLALDAATEACSAALLWDGQVSERYVESGKSHAAQLLSMVEALLAESAVSLSSLDGIAVSIGPGAFTGVRVSVAVAQGLAFGAGLPLNAVSTLESLSLQALTSPDEGALVCLDARMGEVYWGCFAIDALRGVSELSAPMVSAPGRVALPPGAEPPRVSRWWGIGRGFAAYPELKTLQALTVQDAAAACLPRAREMLRIAAPRMAAGEGLDPAVIEPLYLRNNVALTEAQRAATRTAG